jgi:hypothetical protein
VKERPLYVIASKIDGAERDPVPSHLAAFSSEPLQERAPARVSYEK